jgi:DNA-binding NarL/FixJ family response regulator
MKPELSSRQWEALVGAAQGHSLTTIARDMSTTVSAVSGLLAQARDKLGADTTAQAVYLAVTWGIIPLARIG